MHCLFILSLKLIRYTSCATNVSLTREWEIMETASPYIPTPLPDPSVRVGLMRRKHFTNFPLENIKNSVADYLIE